MEMSKIGLVFLSVLIVMAITILGIFVVILVQSPGKPKPFRDDSRKVIAKSVSEKSFIEIDGEKLWFFIKSKNIDNPVLLYLHGGMPDYFLTQQYPTNLEDLFTVVWWEQRGSGLSHDALYTDRSITIDDLMEDTRIITEYLRTRFSQEKIYLMAHSGGTYLGIKVIEKYPELYTAYIGVAQITNQKLSEKLASEYILRKYGSRKSKSRIVSLLTEHPIVLTEPIPVEYLKIRDTAMHDLGIGTMKNMKNIVTGIFLPSLLFREYSISDKINLWKGKANSDVSVLWDEMMNHDLSTENINFEIPVYIFHGIHDYTCSFDLAKAYYKKLEAPRKKFFEFTESSHSPMFEEPGKCIEIIREEILNN